MPYYNTKKEEILNLVSELDSGKSLQIATSEYSLAPNENTGWKPSIRAHQSTVRSLIPVLEATGHKVETFWRGAEIFKK